MSGPDFDDLVDGAELAPAERARLRSAHDALVAAGPPPELSPALAEPPTVGGRVVSLARRRRFAVAVAGVAAAAILFGVGFSSGWAGRGGFQTEIGPVAMKPTAAAPGAWASIRIGKPDRAGNWPSLMNVRGLPELAAGEVYALWLTDAATGRPILVCSVFAVHGGVTTVSFNFPGKVKGRGWIVVREAPGGARGPVLLTT